MDGGYLPPVQLGDVPQVLHVREVAPGDGNGGLYDLAGTYRHDPVPAGRQREYADPVK